MSGSNMTIKGLADPGLVVVCTDLHDLGLYSVLRKSGKSHYFATSRNILFCIQLQLIN